MRRAERGAKAKHIYKVSQEMELRFQLVPRKGIEKAKRAAAEASAAAEGRATARRVRNSSGATRTAKPTPPLSIVEDTPTTSTPVTAASATRRARMRRSVKAAGD
ncbi:MAG: hypothetical protein ICV68_02315 [Pyrinomonadaceae bacterium]|nr:hypothetical protein [Pyrinomonadaceae bacterium]